MKIKELLEIVDAESIDKEYMLALLKEEIFAKKIPNFLYIYNIVVFLSKIGINNYKQLLLTDFPEKRLLKEFQIEWGKFLSSQSSQIFVTIEDNYPSFHEAKTEVDNFFK
jgi:hypothetical protein